MKFQDAIIEAVSASRAVVTAYIQKHNPLHPPVHLTEINRSGWLADQARPEGLICCANQILHKDLIVKVYGDEFDEDWVTPVPSFLLHYEDKALIFVANEKRLNFCHSRFFVAKEIVHALLLQVLPDTVTVLPDAVIDLLSGLINSTTPFDDESPDPQLVEEAAFYGAIEMLMPRELVENDALRLEKSGWSHKEIAKRYRIPLRIVELRLTKLELFNGFYSYNAGQDISRLKFIVGSAQR